MIIVNKVEVFEFRGIRHLEIDFKKRILQYVAKMAPEKVVLLMH